MACERLREWFILHHAPKNQAPAGVLLSDVLDRYVEAKKGATSAPTIKLHAQTWKKRFPGKTIEEACSFTAQESFKTSLVDAGLAVQTINNLISVGRAAVRLAWKRGEITVVPPFSTLPTEQQEPMGRPLSVAECKKLLVAAKRAPHVQQLIFFLIGTAARPSAIMQLDWSQVDGANRIITLNQPGRRQNKKHRPTLKLVPGLAYFLTRSGIYEMPEAGPVVAHNGEHVKSVKTAWRKIRTAAGLDAKVTLYSFRHTMGRWMRSKGVPLDQIQAQLGHRRGGVTERYAEFSPDYLKEASQAIEDFFYELKGGSEVACTEEQLREDAMKLAALERAQTPSETRPV